MSVLSGELEDPPRYPYMPKRKECQNERKRDERVLDDITCSMRRTMHTVPSLRPWHDGRLPETSRQDDCRRSHGVSPYSQMACEEGQRMNYVSTYAGPLTAAQTGRLPQLHTSLVM